MALTDHIYDQALCLRRPPPAKPRPSQHHFRVRLTDRSEHDVLAACAADAETFAMRRRRHHRTRVASCERVGGEGPR
ncbi:hypothetical protein [Shinella pollutisoli]|uniref:Uncharacterized protein n=1 Tax=Shinella pollutisoli TaxID=2250594 RepID=A0ABV7DAA3_9HYPH|nr:hypothetical protein [Shinella pollutisoli]